MKMAFLLIAQAHFLYMCMWCTAMLTHYYIPHQYGLVWHAEENDRIKPACQEFYIEMEHEIHEEHEHKFNIALLMNKTNVYYF
jgi:hypothetical protein